MFYRVVTSEVVDPDPDPAPGSRPGPEVVDPDPRS